MLGASVPRDQICAAAAPDTLRQLPGQAGGLRELAGSQQPLGQRGAPPGLMQPGPCWGHCRAACKMLNSFKPCQGSPS